MLGSESDGGCELSPRGSFISENCGRRRGSVLPNGRGGDGESSGVGVADGIGVVTFGKVADMSSSPVEASSVSSWS